MLGIADEDDLSTKSDIQKLTWRHFLEKIERIRGCHIIITKRSRGGKCKRDSPRTEH